MAAPCASLGSLLTYLPPARPPPLPSCNSRPPLPLVAFVRHHRFLRIRIRALFSSQKGSIVPCSLHGGERERERRGEKVRERHVMVRRIRKRWRRQKKPSWEQPSARRACQVAVYINFIADF